MEDSLQSELRALQARAYGPGDGLAGDDAARRRLEELEGRARRERDLPPVVDRVPASVRAATPHPERVMWVLNRSSKGMQRSPKLTEALTRAFMFADASVSQEIHVVGMQVTRALMKAMADPDKPYAEHEPTEDELAVAKAIGDVWLASLVQWVTGRTTAQEVQDSIDVAVRLLLRQKRRPSSPLS